MSKKGGYYCAFKNCKGLSRRDKRSFFRFPKDPIRSKEWLIACKRDDLLEKTPIELFNSYRVCAKHFTDSMFLNDLRNRLQPTSVPILSDPSKESDDLHDAEKRHSKISNSADSVAKMLSSCIFEKISAEEFFKATGMCVQETVTKAADEFQPKSFSTDLLVTNPDKSEVNKDLNEEGILQITNNNDIESFRRENLTNQHLLNPRPICSTQGESPISLENGVISFSINDKIINIDELSVSILEKASESSSYKSKTFNSLESFQLLPLIFNRSVQAKVELSSTLNKLKST